MRPVSLPTFMEPPVIAIEPGDGWPIVGLRALISVPCMATLVAPLMATVLPAAVILPPCRLVVPVEAKSTLERLVCSRTPSLRLRSEAVVAPGAALVEPSRMAPALPELAGWVSIRPGPFICRGATAAGATVMAPPAPVPDALLLILLLSPSWRDLVLRLMLPPLPAPEAAETSWAP